MGTIYTSYTSTGYWDDNWEEWLDDLYFSQAIKEMELNLKYQNGN